MAYYYDKLYKVYFSVVEENGPPQPLVQSEDEGCRKRKASTNNNPDDEAKKAKSEEETKKTNDDDDEDDDDGASCPICFEPWTNSGDHRIASLKCGHFFGKACIERYPIAF